MKKILNENMTTSLFETVDDKPAGILKRIKGVIADFKPNRNGRVYPKELWENVLNSDYVKEMMDSKCLFGEANHPLDCDRVEIDLNNVSHCIHDMYIEGDSVIGVLDLLPTPAGEIINKLIDYGSKIGVSSRGAGSINSDGIVDPDDYQFFTFDLVPRPSVENARPTVLESEQSKQDKILTEGEIATIMNNYRNIDTKLNDCIKYSYITEGTKESVSSDIISKLIKESDNINKVN